MLSAVTKGYGGYLCSSAAEGIRSGIPDREAGADILPGTGKQHGAGCPAGGDMKVSQEELFGAMATLTGVTGGTAEVTTQLRATMQEF